MSYTWQFSNPEAEGMVTSLLNQTDDYLKQKRYRLINSILVVKNDKIVLEKYYNKFNENSRNNICSIWKSILSICTGICLDKGIIRSLDEPISTYLKEFAQNIHPYHKLITIRHLLTMSSGIYWNSGVHYHCPMLMQMKRSSDWTAHIADVAMSSVPGRRFEYKEWDVILLSALIGKACGGTSYGIAEEYIYKPLDICSDEWPHSPCGISYNAIEGKANSDLSARDLAKIGLLFLNKGKISGKQILSSDFIKEAISPSSGNTSYGYLWWLFPDGYGCRGFGGQEINVIPDKNYVSVIQAIVTPSSKMYRDVNESILKKAIV